MKKVVKKEQITNLIESTMKQAGIITEASSCETDYMGDEYYGSFGEMGDWYDINDQPYEMDNETEWEEAEYQSYEDFINSPYGQDPNNRFGFHMSDNPSDSERLFNAYRDKFGPLRVRTRRGGVDPVQESVKKLSKDASKKNIITENVQKEIDMFNKLINYKY